MKMTILVTLLTISLVPTITHCADPGEENTDGFMYRTMYYVMSLPGPTFDTLRNAFSNLAQAFERLWYSCVGKPLMEEKMPEGPPVQSPPEEAAEVSRVVEDIYLLSSQPLSSQSPASVVDKLTALERDIVATVNTITKKTMMIDLIVGGKGMAFLLWLYKKDPLSIFRKEGQVRFAALATLGALKASSAVLGPVIALITSAIVWHKFKQLIIAPYKAKYASDIEKFRLALAEHKKETDQALLENKRTSVEEQTKFIHHIEGTLTDIRKEFEKELHQEQDRITHLIEADEKDRKELRETIQEDQHQLRQQVIGVTHEIHDKLGSIEHDMITIKDHNKKLHDGLGVALPKLIEMQKFIAEIKTKQDKTMKDLKTAQETSAPAKDAAHKPWLINS